MNVTQCYTNTQPLQLANFIRIHATSSWDSWLSLSILWPPSPRP